MSDSDIDRAAEGWFQSFDQRAYDLLVDIGVTLSTLLIVRELSYPEGVTEEKAEEIARAYYATNPTDPGDPESNVVAFARQYLADEESDDE